MYRMFPHPPEAMFAQPELLEALTAAGLVPSIVRRSLLWNIFGTATKR
jgi:hypothetical protein